MLILVSMVPHGNLDRATNITNTPLGSLFEQAEKFHVVHQYGQHLQRMRTERLEIIYEHAQDIEGPWHEYGHLYKPHNVNGSLTFAGPYFPRFDHKFYDASASTYRQQLWTVSTAFRLLQNNPDVLALFGATEIVPPPRYVRALLYRFQYNELSNGYVPETQQRLCNTTDTLFTPLDPTTGHVKFAANISRPSRWTIRRSSVICARCAFLPTTSRSRSAIGC